MLSEYGFFTNPEQFTSLKERHWKESSTIHQQYLDEELLIILEKLNKNPNIVTVTSCASHPTREKKKRRVVSFINFAVKNQEGLVFLQQIYFHILTKLITLYNKKPYGYGGEAPVPHSFRFTHMAVGIPANDIESVERWYIAVCLNCDIGFCTDNQHKFWYLKALEEAIDFVSSQK